MPSKKTSGAPSPTPEPVDDLGDVYGSPSSPRNGADADEPLSAGTKPELESTSSPQFLLPGIVHPQIAPQSDDGQKASVGVAIAYQQRPELRPVSQDAARIDLEMTDAPSTVESQSMSSNDPSAQLETTKEADKAQLSSSLVDASEDYQVNDPHIPPDIHDNDLLGNEEIGGGSPHSPERTNGLTADEEISAGGTDRQGSHLPEEDIAGSPGEAEYEEDSSPYESSSDDVSDTSSTEDNSEESDEEYTLLDPAEQARRLLEDDGASDEETAKKGDALSQFKTQNEQVETATDIPDISITADMPIEKLGVVQSVVENIVLVKGENSGEYQVLDSGSLLCLENRRAIGTVSETIGRVQEPYYSILFQSGENITSLDISERKEIYYVPQHSTFVFTRPLQGAKGSDASNVHDEEVGAHEIEFSDDEAEAEYKRSRKTQKLLSSDAVENGITSVRTNTKPKKRGRDDRRNRQASGTWSSRPSRAGNETVEDEPYTRLTRPLNLHEMMGNSNLGTEFPQEEPNSSHSIAHRGRGRSRRGGPPTSRGHMRGNANSGIYRPTQPPHVDSQMPASPSYTVPSQGAVSRAADYGSVHLQGAFIPPQQHFGIQQDANVHTPGQQFGSQPQWPSPRFPQAPSGGPYFPFPGPNQSVHQSNGSYYPQSAQLSQILQPGVAVNPSFWTNKVQHQWHGQQNGEGRS